MGQPSDSPQGLDAGCSTEGYHTNMPYCGTDNDVLVSGSPESGYDLPQSLNYQYISYGAEPTATYVPSSAQIVHASSNATTINPSSPGSPGSPARRNRVTPCLVVRKRPNGQRPRERSSNPKKADSPSSHDVSANTNSHRFVPYARPENLCPADCRHDHSHTKSRQSMHPASGYQAPVSIQITDPPFVDSRTKGELLYGPGQQDSGSSHLTERPNGITSFVDPMARSTLYPSK